MKSVIEINTVNLATRGGIYNEIACSVECLNYTGCQLFNFDVTKQVCKLKGFIDTDLSYKDGTTTVAWLMSGMYCSTNSTTGKSSWDKEIHLFECQPTVAVVMGPVAGEKERGYGPSGAILLDRFYIIGGHKYYSYYDRDYMTGPVQYFEERGSWLVKDSTFLPKELESQWGCSVRLKDTSFMFIGIKGALEYNVLSEEIITLASPQTLREYHGCALFKENDGKINVVISGGKEAGGTTSLASTEIYDVDNKIWKSASDMASPRSEHKIVTTSEGTFAIGDSTTVEQFDVATYTWFDTGLALDEPIKKFGAAGIPKLLFV